MVPILEAVSDARGGYMCRLSCSNLEFIIKQHYQKELLLRASTNFWVSRGSLGALSLYRRYNLDFCIRMIFSGDDLGYRYNLIYRPVHPLDHSNSVKFYILWRANSFKLFSYDYKLANIDPNPKNL